MLHYNVLDEKQMKNLHIDSVKVVFFFHLVFPLRSSNIATLWKQPQSRLHIKHELLWLEALILFVNPSQILPIVPVAPKPSPFLHPTNPTARPYLNLLDMCRGRRSYQEQTSPYLLAD